MTIVLAPDSFKGNMTAPEVCDALEEGIRRIHSDATVRRMPLADGGEGTARTITETAGGTIVPVRVTGPLGDPVDAAFGLIGEGKTAVLDMASASGLELIGADNLDPMAASTYGTGELIKAALDSGARELIIGIGGSATNDGGIGMLEALGFAILDEQGFKVGRGGGALGRIASISAKGADPRLSGLSIKVACDVTNPLLGPSGAAAIFGPQKGATPEMVKLLDGGLAKLAEAWMRAGMTTDVEHPGDGAAGGLGAALRICLGAVMESGALLVMKYSGFLGALKNADLVITGEGMTDAQTAGGKLCSVVAREARASGVPVALLSGGLGGDVSALLEHFDYAVSIACGQVGLDAMIRDSRRDLAFAASNLIRAISMKVNDNFNERKPKEEVFVRPHQPSHRTGIGCPPRREGGIECRRVYTKYSQHVALV